MLGVDLQAFWVFRNTTGSEQGKSERNTEWKVCIESREVEEEVRKHMLMFLFISFIKNTRAQEVMH